MDRLTENLIDIDRRIRRRLKWKLLFDHIKSNNSNCQTYSIREIHKLATQSKDISKKKNCFSLCTVNKIRKVRCWKIEWRRNVKHLQSQSFAPEILQKNDHLQTSVISFNGVECLVHDLIGKQNGKSKEKYIENRVKKCSIFPHKQIINNLNVTCPNYLYQHKKNLISTLQNLNVAGEVIKTTKKNKVLNNSSQQPKSLKKGINNIVDYLNERIKNKEDIFDSEKENKKSHCQMNLHSILSRNKEGCASKCDKIKRSQKETINSESKNYVDKSVFTEIQCINKPTNDNDLLIESRNVTVAIKEKVSLTNKNFASEFNEDKSGTSVLSKSDKISEISSCLPHHNEEKETVKFKQNKNLNKLLNNQILKNTEQLSSCCIDLRKIDDGKSKLNESDTIFKIPTLNEIKHKKKINNKETKTSYNTKENINTSLKNIQSHKKNVCVPNSKTKRILESLLIDKSVMQMNNTSSLYDINCKMCVLRNDDKYIYSYFKEVEPGYQYKQILMTVNLVEQFNSNTTKYILGMRVLEEFGKVDDEKYKSLYRKVKDSFSLLSKFIEKNLLDAYKNYVLWLYEHRRKS